MYMYVTGAFVEVDVSTHTVRCLGQRGDEGVDAKAAAAALGVLVSPAPTQAAASLVVAAFETTERTLPGRRLMAPALDYSHPVLSRRLASHHALVHIVLLIHRLPHTLACSSKP